MTWKQDIISQGEQRLAELDTVLIDLEGRLRNGKAEYAEVLKTLDGLGWNHRPVKVEVRGKAIAQDGMTEEFQYCGRTMVLKADLLRELDNRLGAEFAHGEVAAILRQPGHTLGTSKFHATVYLTYLIAKGRVESVSRGYYRRVRPKDPKVRDTVEEGAPFPTGPGEQKGYGQL